MLGPSQGLGHSLQDLGPLQELDHLWQDIVPPTYWMLDFSVLRGGCGTWY